MKLEDATNIYVGTSSASKIYVGTTQVWPQRSTNVDPNMYMIDVPTFKSLNSISTTSAWSTWAGTYSISNGATMNVGAPTWEIIVGDADHSHLYITDDNGSNPYYFVLESDAVVKFTGMTFTKIVLKDTVYHPSDISSITVNSGSFTYDAAADEYVWTGNTNNVEIDINGLHRIDFKYIYFE